MGKGSKPRPISVPKNQYDSNWDSVFSNKEKENGLERTTISEDLQGSDPQGPAQDGVPNGQQDQEAQPRQEQQDGSGTLVPVPSPQGGMCWQVQREGLHKESQYSGASPFMRTPVADQERLQEDYGPDFRKP